MSTKRILYYVFMPEVLTPNPNEPPIPTMRGTMIPVVNCPMLDRGDRFLAELCMTCQYNKFFGTYIECGYELSQQEKDEWERRRKGVSRTVQTPIQHPTVQPNKMAELKDPGQPKNVFVPNKK
jgi:hypothetical protein